MTPLPATTTSNYKGSEKLKGKNVIITGWDSGIGRAVSIVFAKEGANVAIVYLSESKDAEETKQLVEEQGGRCLLLSGDIGDESFCQEAVQQAVDEFGGLDIVVNNAAEQHTGYFDWTAGKDISNKYFLHVSPLLIQPRLQPIKVIRRLLTILPQKVLLRLHPFSCLSSIINVKYIFRDEDFILR